MLKLFLQKITYERNIISNQLYSISEVISTINLKKNGKHTKKTKMLTD